jgi:FAD/FMN-containing dehydrogenase
VVLDLDDRESHGKPWNTYHIMQSVPDVVVYPLSQEEVVAVVKACARYKVCFSHTLLYLTCSFGSSVNQDSDCIELQHWVVPNQRSIQTVVCE